MRLRLLFLIAICAFLPTNFPDACGLYDNDVYGYSFWKSEIVAQKSDYAPYFLNFADMSKYYEEIQKVQVEDNLIEWQKKVCESASIEDIAAVIYSGTLTELNLLKTIIQSGNRYPSGRFKQNQFAAFLNSNACSETINYLIYAKKCEPLALALDPWNEDTKDYPAMQDLIREGQKRFKKTNSQFLKLRYAYQIIRLAHYRKDYAYVIELYDYLLPKIDPVLVNGVKSLIYWWILGHKAGAELQLGNNIEAAYLFSRIFAQCPSKRESAFRSFSIKNKEEWNEVLKKCKNDRERAVIYSLRANAADSRAIEDMMTIYELDPLSRHLEVLLVKEIKELERDLLGLKWNSHKYRNKKLHSIPRVMAGDYVIELQQFARNLRKEKKVANPNLWYLAEGYLELLAGDNYAAAQTFKEVRPLIQEEALTEQLKVFELALEITAFNKIDDKIERTAYDIIKDNDVYKSAKSFPNFLRDRMSVLYKKNDHPGKAFRSEHQILALKTNLQEDVINDLMNVCLNDNRNPFERLMVENKNGELITNELWDMKAVLALQDYQLEAALLAMRKMPRTEWDKFGRFDPFRATVRDCISCPHSKDSIDLFNRGDLIIKLLDLEGEARAEPKKAPKNYFKIGIAIYNMTFFGHSWNARDYYRSGSSWDELTKGKSDVFSVNDSDYHLGNKEILNTERALYYFDKCRLLTDNQELAAKATFMAAKCELALFYQSGLYRRPKGRNTIPYIAESFQKNYKLLKEQYSETQFYQEIIEECAFFKAYATK